MKISPEISLLVRDIRKFETTGAHLNPVFFFQLSHTAACERLEAMVLARIMATRPTQAERSKEYRLNLKQAAATHPPFHPLALKSQL